jgi:hypothetical protein
MPPARLSLGRRAGAAASLPLRVGSGSRGSSVFAKRRCPLQEAFPKSAAAAPGGRGGGLRKTTGRAWRSYRWIVKFTVSV